MKTRACRARRGRAAAAVGGRACWSGRDGHIKLTNLIAKQCSLDEINQGYQHLMDGKNIRGVVAQRH